MTSHRDILVLLPAAEVETMIAAGWRARQDSAAIARHLGLSESYVANVPARQADARHAGRTGAAS